MNGFALPDSLLISNFRKIMLFLKLKLKMKQRGFTSNTIVRKKAVKGVKLPDLRRLEDIILQEEIKERGWKWKFAPAFCLHLKSANQILIEAKKDLKNMIETGSLLGAISRL